jgi:hypothetical protein
LLKQLAHIGYLQFSLDGVKRKMFRDNIQIKFVKFQWYRIATINGTKNYSDFVGLLLKGNK